MVLYKCAAKGLCKLLHIGCFINSFTKLFTLSITLICTIHRMRFTKRYYIPLLL